MPKAPVITSITPPGPIDVAVGQTSAPVVVAGKEYDVDTYEVKLKHNVSGLESEPGTVAFNLEDTSPEDLQLIVTPVGTTRGVVTVTGLSFTVRNP